MIVWVLWLTYYLSRATRSLQQRPYTAFRCRGHEPRVQALCAAVCSPAVVISKSYWCL